MERKKIQLWRLSIFFFVSLSCSYRFCLISHETNSKDDLNSSKISVINRTLSSTHTHTQRKTRMGYDEKKTKIKNYSSQSILLFKYNVHWWSYQKPTHVVQDHNNNNKCWINTNFFPIKSIKKNGNDNYSWEISCCDINEWMNECQNVENFKQTNEKKIAS